MTVQYLIDSENVGDFWISLLELPADQTELIVFYTRNSPHMSYESLIKLKESDRTVTFIKCYEGTNALDFQLVTELGYRISKNESDRFVIVTNDTGFDAAVKYWRRSKKSVKRITGKECKNLERRRREDLEWRNTSLRTRDQVISSSVDEEEAETTAVSAAVSSTDSAGMQDARPSRPVLRDAETAAEPEPEETEFAEETYDDVPENGDPDYDPDIEEEEDDLEEISSDDISSDDISSDQAFSDEISSDQASSDETSLDEDPSDEMSSDEMSPEDESVYEGSGDENGPEGENDTADYNDAEYSDEEAVSETGDREAGQDFRKDLSEDFKKGFLEKHFDEAVPEDVKGEEGSVPAPSGSFEKADTSNKALNDHDSSDSETSTLPAVENTDTAEDSDSGDSASSEPGSDAEAAEKENKKKSVAAKQDETEENPESTDSGHETDDPTDSPHRTRSRRSRSRRTKSGSKKAESIENSPEDSPSEEHKGAKSAAKAPDAGSAPADSAQSTAAEEGLPGDEEIARIVACIGPDNLAELHNQLATIYGDQGKDIYLSIKNNTRSIPVLKPDLRQKFEYYCEIIFARSDYTGEYPADISEYLLSVREKLNNLTSLRYALLKHYGKEKGRRFYFLLKPFAKTMYQM